MRKEILPVREPTNLKNLKSENMKYYSSINHRSKKPCVVALGCFDGVHIGHGQVIKAAKEKATQLNCQCAVWTFSEPPKNYFSPGAAPLITDSIEKRKLIASLGVDKLISVPFCEKTARITAEDFFYSILIDKLKAVHIVCGYDYSFGAKGMGNTSILKELCEENSIGLTILPSVCVNGIPVSSSAIRDAISNGNISEASCLLGRHYAIKAKIINGQHLARSLGFPTVNQRVPDKLLVPKHGVYVSRISIEGIKKKFYGITNVGERPTVDTEGLFVETYIFDFSGDIYGKYAKIEFLHFIREETKFDSIETLTQQVNKDIKSALHYIESQKR